MLGNFGGLQKHADGYDQTAQGRVLEVDLIDTAPRQFHKEQDLGVEEAL
jgi:hypothetical protein